MKKSHNYNKMKRIMIKLICFNILALIYTPILLAEKVLIIAQAGDVATIDNQQSVGPAKNATIQIYDWQLLRFKSVLGPKGKTLSVHPRDMIPGIIVAWKAIPNNDGSCIQKMRIRPGAVFHSGNPVTAHDLKYAWIRRAALGRDLHHRQLGAMYTYKEGLNESIKIIDDLNLEVKTKKCMPLFYDTTATHKTYFDSKLVKENSTSEDPWGLKFVAKNDAGSGPFTIKDWKVGNEMVLERFENYYGPRPPIDKMIFKTVPDLSSRVLLLKNGDIDIALNIPQRELNHLKKDPNINVVSAPSGNKLFIGMSNNLEPFNNKNVRLALTYAFPYEAVFKSVFTTGAQKLYGPIPTGVEGALSKRMYSTDLKKAKNLLNQANLGNNINLTIKWQTGNPTHEKIAILFKDNLKKIGVNLKIQQLPVGQFSTGIRSKKLDFFVTESLAWVLTPEYIGSLNYVSKNAWNTVSYSNKRVDELVEKALNEANNQKRLKLNIEMQEIILSDVPYIYVAQPDFQLAMRANIVGYTAQNTGLHHLWMVDKL